MTNSSSIAVFGFRSRVTYSPTFVAGTAFPETEVVHDCDVLPSRENPPTSTVAVTVIPPIPAVSTMMVGVPCPELIVPAETVQLNVGDTVSSPPFTLTVNVRSFPASTESGQVTLIIGQLAAAS